jgi:hypothetical protein
VSSDSAGEAGSGVTGLTAPESPCVLSSASLTSSKLISFSVKSKSFPLLSVLSVC